ncbi:MAG: hypothetical protein Hyperionvirus14_40 [Hyperionvirus sp.]|uniref:Uncharacterized protein n=1 Tax=Hyperionvirus sp. TaxID=2487770 RepID=A0A3G5ACG1_9VIRU|nr:MAG: hypothetical protein Hyperionvirus14_40 [Hyperionvirus sp.]
MGEIFLGATYYVIRRAVCINSGERSHVRFYTCEGEIVGKGDIVREELEAKKSERLDGMLDPKCKSKKILIDKIVFKNGFVYFLDRDANVLLYRRYEGKVRMKNIVGALENELSEKNLDVSNAAVENFHDDWCVIL